jgi:endonuclease III
MATAARLPAPPTLRSRLQGVADTLAGVYGRPRPWREDPLDGLIRTILSQNTSDVNSSRAFAALKAAYPTWARAAAAPARSIERVIRKGGLARVKSRRIRAVLRAVRQREGRYDLGVLRRLDRAAAEARLSGLSGVGPKTRACVLLFCCGKDAFPVDTHVHRVASRLGLIPPGADAARAHVILGGSLPAGRALDLHLNLVRLGRESCRPRAPRCAGCPLSAGCPFPRGRA